MKRIKSKLLIKFIILVYLLAGWACKKVIQVDLNNAVPQIVIEGELTNIPGPYQVRISKTVNFGAPNTFPPVSGATVRITDSTIRRTAYLSETTPGVYTTSSLAGIPKHTYNLSVTAEGKQYTASSIMPGTVNLDSVTFVQNLDLNNKRIIDAVVNFQDPRGLGNYYQFTEEVNNLPVPDIFVFEDRLSDGKYIRETLFNDTSRLQINDSLLVKMYCIDKNIYNYFYTLRQVTGNNSFRSATPANPNTNISNGALGYFSAHTVTSRKLRVY